MLVDGDGRAPSAAPSALADPAADPGADLDPATAVDQGVEPLFRRLLTRSRGLLGTVAGSISLVDAARGHYVKIAENGIACQLGRSFPLDEGATGEAVARRMPVVIDAYRDLRGGHLSAGHPAGRGAAAAVPLWWRGEVIGVNVAFAGRRRRFTAAEIDAFELLTQSVAPAVVRAGSTVPSLAGLLRERTRHGGHGVPTFVTEVGVAQPVPEEVATAAADLVALVGRAAALRASTSRLHVAVVHRPEGLRLLVQDEDAEVVASSVDPLGLGTRTWNELLAVTGGELGGHVGVEHVAGWGTLLRADFPNAPTAVDPSRGGPSADDPSADTSPLTPREHEVLRLLAAGLSDREVAARLVISRKTVEKHVGAVLRKTGSASRTAAVVLALDRGWLASDDLGEDDSTDP
jgi:DNA-binding CsgD family transcriptional regulator